MHREIVTSNQEMSTGMGVGGRFYALGQVLAREQERSAVLQQQLEQRIAEVDHLRTEVEQLRAHEAEMETALQAAGPGQQPEAAIEGSEAAQPRKRRPAEAPEAPRVQEAALADTRDDQTAQARAEAATAQVAAAQAAVASVQAALLQEQQRREQTEAELARLKQETSAPPYGRADGTDAQLAAAKEEVADLRTALQDERTTRERLAQEFNALQQQAAAASTSGSPDNGELEERLRRLQEEKQAVTDSFTRSLAESQKRAADLEQQLVTARAAAPAPSAEAVAPATGAEVGAIRAENAALRSRLDEEHRRTEELAAKLKIATRVTDLIFKMQAQPTQAQPLRAR